jgi:hypothetical protein
MQRDLRDNPPGPDGVVREPDEQKRINEVLAVTFRGEGGKAALDYLRSISIERVCGPFASDAELRHLEGMRFVVGVISQRIAAHNREMMNAGASTKPAPRVPASAPIAGQRL